MTAGQRIGRFEELPESEPYEGLLRRTFDSEHATVSEYRFEPGARFPLHTHPEEQLTFVTEGEIELTAGDEVTRLVKGNWAVLAGGVPHSIRAPDGSAGILAVVIPRRASPTAYTVVE